MLFLPDQVLSSPGIPVSTPHLSKIEVLLHPDPDTGTAAFPYNRSPAAPDSEKEADSGPPFLLHTPEHDKNTAARHTKK